jgi:hypothetical protein
LQGIDYKKYQTMTSIVVPYRDRYDHLRAFHDHLFALGYIHLPEWELVIVEQNKDLAFNRGYLLNIGAMLSINATHFVFHDVDMLPKKWIYEKREGVTQLISSKIQTKDYLGGVTMFDAETFFDAGGYSNLFYSRAEDNEMMFNLKRRSVPIKNEFHEFEILDHARPKVEFDPLLWKKAQWIRDEEDDGIWNMRYDVITDEWLGANVRKVTVRLFNY